MNKLEQSIQQLSSTLQLKTVDCHKLFNEGLSPLQSVETFLKEQVRQREARANELRLKRSYLPTRKTIQEFDFGFQRSITKE